MLFGPKLDINNFQYFSKNFNRHLSQIFPYISFSDCLVTVIKVIPCPFGQLCMDEDKPDNVVSGYQFTFRIRDMYESRFWYISLVSCRRNNSTCKWDYVSDFEGIVQYDIRYGAIHKRRHQSRGRGGLPKNDLT